MLADLALVAGGLVLLTLGASVLVRGASSLALRLGLTPLVVGLTVVAFGTSAPEMVVSVQAALSGNGAIAIGNVVGSNIANVGLILALAALIAPFSIHPTLLRRDAPLVVVVSALAVALLWNGTLSAVEGGVLVAGLVAYVVWSVRHARAAAAVAAATDGVPDAPSGSPWFDALRVAGGLVGLVLGADWLVGGAVSLATVAGVSPAVIGLTVVAVGTSLPELATSVVAALRGHPEIAAGNVVGSNLFNLLGILGTAALVRPLDGAGFQTLDYAVMGGFAVAMVAMMLVGRRLDRLDGALLLAAYASYIVYLATQHG